MERLSLILLIPSLLLTDLSVDSFRGQRMSWTSGSRFLGNSRTRYLVRHNKIELQDSKKPALVVLSQKNEEVQTIENSLQEQGFPPLIPNFHRKNATRDVFCCRTLDLNSIKVIGYDMDYTLVRYRVNAIEQRAYHYAKEWLNRKGFHVSGLEFIDDLVCRGLIVDKLNGNILKVDRFGYVSDAMHGTRALSSEEIHLIYGKLVVALKEKRWAFLNTLFSVSEATIYLQLVDRLDDGSLEKHSTAPFNFSKCDSHLKLFKAASKSVFRAHVTSNLKSEMVSDLAKFVELDPELVPTLVAQRMAGKKLALITNSDWTYTDKIMKYLVGNLTYQPTCSVIHSSGVLSWRGLFDIVVVSASKPDFFSAQPPLFEVELDSNHLESSNQTNQQNVKSTAATPVSTMPSNAITSLQSLQLKEVSELKEGGVFQGGSALMIEALFNSTKENILFVGDHMFADVMVAKSLHRWRTVLILQELEDEVKALGKTAKRKQIHRLFQHRDRIKGTLNNCKSLIDKQRAHHERLSLPFEPSVETKKHIDLLLDKLASIDQLLVEKFHNYGKPVNKFWGFLSRSGFGDKTHIIRQIEKNADVYTSRVSNLYRYSPYAYFRAEQQALAHEFSP